MTTALINQRGRGPSRCIALAFKLPRQYSPHNVWPPSFRTVSQHPAATFGVAPSCQEQSLGAGLGSGVLDSALESEQALLPPSSFSTHGRPLLGRGHSVTVSARLSPSACLSYFYDFAEVCRGAVCLSLQLLTSTSIQSLACSAAKASASPLPQAQHRVRLSMTLGPKLSCSLPSHLAS
jgi:hypothetical protein